jgi:hypothetical protein
VEIGENEDYRRVNMMLVDAHRINIRWFSTISGYVRRNLSHFILWFTEVIVFFSIGFAMIGGTLTLPLWLGGDLVSMIAGWILVIITVFSVLISIVNTFRSIITKKSPFSKAVEADVFDQYQWLVKRGTSICNSVTSRKISRDGCLEDAQDVSCRYAPPIASYHHQRNRVSEVF